jgi:hypothetical protein
MNELNLHGRHPKDLPDKETIDDILLELEDTNKFDITWIDLKSFDSYMNWKANGKVFNEWKEKGEVRTCEIDHSSMRFNLDPETPSYLSFKETRYDIVRYPIRLEVKFIPKYIGVNPSTFSDASFLPSCFDDEGYIEALRMYNDTYLRLKDYLDPDVIQDQYQSKGFIIDLMISECEVI